MSRKRTRERAFPVSGLCQAFPRIAGKTGRSRHPGKDDRGKLEYSIVILGAQDTEVVAVWQVELVSDLLKQTLDLSRTGSYPSPISRGLAML